MIINLKDGKFIRVDIKKNEKGVYEYYSEGILLGVYDPSVMKDGKFLEIDLERNHTINDEVKDQIRDEINDITRQIEEKINEADSKSIEEEAEENRALGEYLREIGVDDKSFKKIDEISLKSEETETQEKPNEQEQVDSNENDNVMEASRVDAKQEIELDERATDMQNFKRWLETSSGRMLPSGATKIIAIDSDELRKMKDENGRTIDNASSQWGLAIVRKDENGKMVAEPLKKYLPELEQSRSAGTNPRKIQQQITEKTDGRMENPNPVNAEFTIDGSKRNIIDIDQDHLNDMEVHIGKYGPHTNETTRTQVRGKNTTFATDTQARKAAMGNFKGVHSGEESKKELEECKDDKKDYRDGDGDHTTKSEDHIAEMARRILENNDEISSNYNQNDVEEYIIRAMSEDNSKLTEEEFMEKISSEMETANEQEHEPKGPQNRQ